MDRCGDSSCEVEIKGKTVASTRCMPLDKQGSVSGKCLHCGKENTCRIYFGRSY